MVQLAEPVDPFGEVNVYRNADGTLQIVATILTRPDIERAATGLALDASASMQKWYGNSRVLSPVFKSESPNIIQPIAQAMAKHLAEFSGNGKTHLIYWALKPDGTGIEEIGVVGVHDADQLKINGPQTLAWGRGTKLLPPVRYFVEHAFLDASWAIAVIITDGVIEDLNEVKQYCMSFARQIAAGKRNFIKFVLIGVGDQIDEEQMTELDDMFEGTDLRAPDGSLIDLWDHKIAYQMRQLDEIYAEVVREDMIVSRHGRIFDDQGRLVRNYSDGLPAMLRFNLPAGCRSFSLEFSGGRITQPLIF
jgi:hypothetical protein